GAKVRSMLDLSERELNGTLRLGRIGRLDDEGVIAQLVPARGVGRWTAHMFLMFTLGRLDVWPTGDYGVRAGFGKAWGIEMPTEKQLEPLGPPLLGAWFRRAGAAPMGGRPDLIRPVGRRRGRWARPLVPRAGQPARPSP